MQTSFKTLLAIALLPGCFKPLGSTQGVVNALPGVNAETSPTTAATINAGKVSSLINPNATTPQTIKTDAAGAISGSSVTFPPGSLAIAATMVVEQAYPLSQTSVLTELGIDTSVRVRNAAAGVIIRPSVDVTLTSPMTLQIPAPALGLALGDSSSVGILYRVWKGSAEGLESGIIPTSDITIVNGFAQFNTLNFGAFQAVAFSAPITEKKAAKTDESILNISGTTVVEKAGYVPESKIAAADQIELLSFSTFAFSYDDASLSYRFEGKLKTSGAVSGCKIRVERSDGLVRSYDVAGLSGSFARVTPDAVGTKASLSCLDASSRLFTSDTSAIVNVKALALGTIDLAVKASSDGNANYNFTGTYAGQIPLQSCVFESSGAESFATVGNARVVSVNLTFGVPATELSEAYPYFRVRCTDSFQRQIIEGVNPDVISFAPTMAVAPTGSIYVTTSDRTVSFSVTGGKLPITYEVVDQTDAWNLASITAAGVFTAPISGMANQWTVKITDAAGTSQNRVVTRIQNVYAYTSDHRIDETFDIAIQGGIKPFTVAKSSGNGAVVSIDQAASSFRYHTDKSATSTTVRIKDSSGLYYDLTFQVNSTGQLDPTFGYNGMTSLNTSGQLSNNLLGFIPLANGDYLFGGDAWLCCSPVTHSFTAARVNIADNLLSPWTGNSASPGLAYDLTADDSNNAATTVVLTDDQQAFYLLGYTTTAGVSFPTITKHLTADGSRITAWNNSIGQFDVPGVSNGVITNAVFWQNTDQQFLFVLVKQGSFNYLYKINVTGNIPYVETSFYGDTGQDPLGIGYTGLDIIGDELILFYNYAGDTHISVIYTDGTAGPDSYPAFSGTVYGGKMINGHYYIYGNLDSGGWVVSRLMHTAGSGFTNDAGFGTGSLLYGDPTAGVDVARDVIEQPDGNVVVAIGYDERYNNSEQGGSVHLLRFSQSGVKEATFDAAVTVPAYTSLSYRPAQVRYVQSGTYARLIVTYLVNGTSPTGMAAFIP